MHPDNLNTTALVLLASCLSSVTILWRCSYRGINLPVLQYICRTMLAGIFAALNILTYPWTPDWFQVVFSNACYLFGALFILFAMRWRFGLRRRLREYRAVHALIAITIAILFALHQWVDDALYYLTMVMGAALLLIVGLAMQTFHAWGGRLSEGDQFFYIGIVILIFAQLAIAFVSIVYNDWVLLYSVAFGAQIIANIFFLAGVLISIPEWQRSETDAAHSGEA